MPYLNDTGERNCEPSCACTMQIQDQIWHKIDNTFILSSVNSYEKISCMKEHSQIVHTETNGKIITFNQVMSTKKVCKFYQKGLSAKPGSK